MIRRLLATYLFFIVIPLAAVTGVGYSLYKNGMENQVARSIDGTVKLLHKEAEDYFDNYVRLAGSVMLDEKVAGTTYSVIDILGGRKPEDALSGGFEAYDQAQKIQFILNNLLNKGGGALNTVYLYTDGGERFYSNRTRHEPYSPDTLAEFADRLRESEREWIFVQNDASANRESVYLVRRIGQPFTHAYLGCIVMEIHLSELADTIRMGQVPEQSVYVLWNGTRPVYGPEGNWADTGIAVENRDGRMQVTAPEEHRYLLSSATAAESEWTVVSLLPQNRLSSGIDQVRNWIMAAAGLSILLSIAIAYGMAVGIANPVKRVRNAMRKFEAQLLSTRVTVQGRDEVAELAVGFNHMAERLQSLIDQVYRAEIAEKDAQLRALQAQIHPHFLHNTLESIRMLAEIRGASDVGEMTRALGVLFRAATEYSTLIPVEVEWNLVRQYLLIQEYRFDGTLTVDASIEPEVRNVLVPKLTLQPIVENCIQHGLMPRRAPREGMIRLRAYRESEFAIVEVMDDGVGMSAEALRELVARLQSDEASDDGESVGLTNVHRRIRLQCGREYGLSVTSAPNVGTRIVIRLPMDKGRGGSGDEYSDRR
ncbi:cache domain-containing sensor histidine kinase [Cohnella cellulosilytica]|uniref:histidine kinase n=1 Tax=Cohnella cellulosilytica TaxID=986710 RepID=A0ABW2FJG0_9BACL